MCWLDAAAVARSAVLNYIVVAPGSSTPCATRRGGASQPFALRGASWGRQPAVRLLRLCGCAQTTRDLRPTLMRFVYLGHLLHFPSPIYNGAAAISFTVRPGATART